MTRNIIRIIGNILGLYIAAWLVSGFVINGGIKEYILAGFILGLLNIIVKPVLKIITSPLIIISLGLFIIVINALLLWIVDYFFDFMVIANLWSLVWATIIIGLVNVIVASSAKPHLNS